jgi:hypothetical protein
MSVNAPAGACSQALGLLGPTSTLSSGESSGLLALVLAAEWLASRDDADAIIAGGVDELSGAPDDAEGAACLALTRSAEAGEIVVVGWGIAGRDCAHEAVERAMAGRSFVEGLIVDGEAPVALALKKWTATSGLGVIEASRFWGAAESTRSSVMAVVAAAHIAARHAQSVLVVAARGASSVAMVLERGPR